MARRLPFCCLAARGRREQEARRRPGVRSRGWQGVAGSRRRLRRVAARPGDSQPRCAVERAWRSQVANGSQVVGDGSRKSTEAEFISRASAEIVRFRTDPGSCCRFGTVSNPPALPRSPQRSPSATRISTSARAGRRLRDIRCCRRRRFVNVSGEEIRSRRAGRQGDGAVVIQADSCSSGHRLLLAGADRRLAVDTTRSPSVRSEEGRGHTLLQPRAALMPAVRR